MQYLLGNVNDSEAFFNYLLRPTSPIKHTGRKIHDRHYMLRVTFFKKINIKFLNCTHGPSHQKKFLIVKVNI